MTTMKSQDIEDFAELIAALGKEALEDKYLQAVALAVYRAEPEKIKNPPRTSYMILRYMLREMGIQN